MTPQEALEKWAGITAEWEDWKQRHARRALVIKRLLASRPGIDGLASLPVSRADFDALLDGEVVPAGHVVTLRGVRVEVAG